MTIPAASKPNFMIGTWGQCVIDPVAVCNHHRPSPTRGEPLRKRGEWRRDCMNLGQILRGLHLRCCKMSRGQEVLRKLKRICVQTLVTVGAQDLVTPACARTVHRGIRGSRLVILRKSGHDALSKERDLYIEAVRVFLDSVSH